MTVLPIVGRELRVAARRRATHGLRFGAAFTVLLAGALVLGVSRPSLPPHRVGQAIFDWIAWLSFFFCLFCGGFLTADSLSSERRHGTLGLLFLTRLRGYDVVLGKLSAHSVQSAYALLAILPVLALPLLLGGVTGGEFARVAMVLLVMLGFSLCIGIGVSSFFADARAAVVTAFGVLLVVLAGGPLAAVILWLAGSASDPGEVWYYSSPLALLVFAGDDYYRRAAGVMRFWTGLGVWGTLALVALGVAAWRLPRSLRDRAQAPPLFGSAPVAPRPSGLGPPRVRSRHRSTGDLERNPFGWLAGRDGLGRRIALAGLVPLGVIWTFCLAQALLRHPRDDRGEVGLALCLGLAWVAHVGLKVVLAAESVRRFSEDRRSGALEVLLSTPLRPDRILSGEVRALQRQFRLPLVGVVGLNLALVATLAGWGSPWMADEPRAFFLRMLLLGTGMLLVEAHALARVGMWMGLRCRTAARAMTSTLVWVFAPSWGVAVLYLILMTTGSSASDDTFETFAVVWALGCMGYAGWLARHAGRRVSRDFLDLVADTV